MDPLHFDLIRGDSRTLIIPTNLDEEVYNATTASVLVFSMKAQDELSKDDSVAKAQKDLNAGLRPTTTGVEVDLVHVDTADLLPSKTYQWDVQAMDSTGVHTVAIGTIKVIADVTRNLIPSTPIYTTNPPLPTGGQSVAFSAVAAVALGSGRFVHLAPDGLHYADAAQGIPAHGFVREAYNAGRTCVVEKLGELNGLSGLASSSTYYLAANGLITQTAPTSGVSQSVGFASAADTLQVTISDPIIFP